MTRMVARQLGCGLSVLAAPCMNAQPGSGPVGLLKLEFQSIGRDVVVQLDVECGVPEVERSACQLLCEQKMQGASSESTLASHPDRVRRI